MKLENSFKNLSFYAIRIDFNTHIPVYVNVMEYFDDEVFYEALNKYESIKDYSDLYKWVVMNLKYSFINKAEHEMTVNGILNTSELSRVISIWDQVGPNAIVITDMINEAFGLGYTKVPVKEPKFYNVVKGEE